jgi:hypothetical protein
MTVPSAYQFAETLQKMGIDIPNLGCVMLDVEPLDASTIIPEEWQYHSRDPRYHWINGTVAGNHVTLKFGLLQNANLIKDAVDEVLMGWWPYGIYIKNVDFFPSSIPDEEYACIIAHVDASGSLKEANARLSFLPHIDTHEDYNPHLTLAYVKPEYTKRSIDLLQRAFGAYELKPGSLNYGRAPQ